MHKDPSRCCESLSNLCYSPCSEFDKEFNRYASPTNTRVMRLLKKERRKQLKLVRERRKELLERAKRARSQVQQNLDVLSILRHVSAAKCYGQCSVLFLEDDFTWCDGVDSDLRWVRRCVLNGCLCLLNGCFLSFSCRCTTGLSATGAGGRLYAWELA